MSDLDEGHIIIPVFIPPSVINLQPKGNPEDEHINIPTWKIIEGYIEYPHIDMKDAPVPPPRKIIDVSTIPLLSEENNNNMNNMTTTENSTVQVVENDMVVRVVEEPATSENTVLQMVDSGYTKKPVETDDIDVISTTDDISTNNESINKDDKMMIEDNKNTIDNTLEKKEDINKTDDMVIVEQSIIKEKIMTEPPKERRKKREKIEGESSEEDTSDEAYMDNHYCRELLERYHMSHVLHQHDDSENPIYPQTLEELPPQFFARAQDIYIKRKKRKTHYHRTVQAPIVESEVEISVKNKLVRLKNRYENPPKVTLRTWPAFEEPIIIPSTPKSHGASPRTPLASPSYGGNARYSPWLKKSNSNNYLSQEYQNYFREKKKKRYFRECNIDQEAENHFDIAEEDLNAEEMSGEKLIQLKVKRPPRTKRPKNHVQRWEIVPRTPKEDETPDRLIIKLRRIISPPPSESTTPVIKNSSNDQNNSVKKTARPKPKLSISTGNKREHNIITIGPPYGGMLRPNSASPIPYNNTSPVYNNSISPINNSMSPINSSMSPQSVSPVSVAVKTTHFPSKITGVPVKSSNNIVRTHNNNSNNIPILPNTRVISPVHTPNNIQKNMNMINSSNVNNGNVTVTRMNTTVINNTNNINNNRTIVHNNLQNRMMNNGTQQQQNAAPRMVPSHNNIANKPINNNRNTNTSINVNSLSVKNTQITQQYAVKKTTSIPTTTNTQPLSSEITSNNVTQHLQPRTLQFTTSPVSSPQAPGKGGNNNDNNTVSNVNRMIKIDELNFRDAS